jgi:DNA-binding response OmpR family regulator
VKRECCTEEPKSATVAAVVFSMDILVPLAYACTRIPPMNAEYRGLSPLNILLAEDERAVAFSIVFALKTDGHNVQVVADGWQALASINVEPDRFGLLITDHSMPGMTGVELIQRLRQESFRGKIMVLSAHLSAENRAAYEALAVDAMISKPLDVHELRATITRLAHGMKSRVGENAISPAALHNMLKSALEPEEPDEAFEGGS